MSCRIYFGISRDKLTIMHSDDSPGVYIASGMPNRVRHDGVNEMSCRIYFGISQDKLTRCMASTGQASTLQVGCRTEFGMTGNKMSCRIYFGISRDKLTIMHCGDLPRVYLAGGMPNRVRHDGRFSVGTFPFPQINLFYCCTICIFAAWKYIVCLSTFYPSCFKCWWRWHLWWW